MNGGASVPVNLPDRLIMSILPTHSAGSLGSFARGLAVIPINDLKGPKSSRDGEQVLRCKLAALYRVVDLCGWSHGIYNHISVRVDEESNHFLINPLGMLYSEITASALNKVDLKGTIVERGSSPFGVSKAGFALHSAIHEARPDIKCIIHLHTPAAVAVSAMKCGLLPICQEAVVCGDISYHDYHGMVVKEDEKKTLVEKLGPSNKILMLRNQGFAACGETIEEAFHLTFNLLAACESQIRTIPFGVDNIVMPSDEAKAQANRVANMGGGKGWKTGQIEFEALMRALDNLGYRTGYDYKLLPLQKTGS